MVAITSGMTPWRIIGSTSARLNRTPRIRTDTAMPIKRGRPERQAEIAGDQNEEGRQHHEFALREIDRLRGLPQQRKSDRRQRIDRAGGQAGDQQLQDFGRHAFALTAVCAFAHLQMSAAR